MTLIPDDELPEPVRRPGARDRDELLTLISELIAGMQVPLSMGMPIGAARDPLISLLHECGAGWLDAATIRACLQRQLS